MFENIPELIKKTYTISLVLTAASLILGIFLKMPELYAGFYKFDNLNDKCIFNNDRGI